LPSYQVFVRIAELAGGAQVSLFGGFRFLLNFRFRVVLVSGTDGLRHITDAANSKHLKSMLRLIKIFGYFGICWSLKNGDFLEKRSR
jgi:hypothetical protein